MGGRVSAGVVLAGGRSSRMGTPKAALEWHGSTLLYRTAAVLARAVTGPVVVVAAPGQKLPALPRAVEVVEDPVEGLGPLQGVASGLAAVGSRAATAFVCSTDLPFLHPAFAAAVLRATVPVAGEEGDEPDMVMPVVRGYRQPLTAGYRTRMAGLIQDRVAAGDRRPGMLMQHCHVRLLDDATLLADSELARLDPELDSVVNVNDPGDYAEARSRPAPEVVVESFGVLPAGGRRGPRRVRAATLGEAAAAVGVVLDRYVVAALNGDQITRDEALPLVRGDVLALVASDAGG